MKKVFLLCCLVLAALTVSAQEDHHWTVKVGGGLHSIVGSDADTDSRFSYKVGISYDLSISENFFIVPELDYANKAWKSDAIDGNLSVSYIQVPIFAAYKFHLNDNMKLAIKAGPYFAYGLFGSDVTFYDYGDYNIFDDEIGWKRFDAGLAAGVSLEISQFEIGLEYSRGFTKTADGLKAYNQAFGLTLGYRF